MSLSKGTQLKASIKLSQTATTSLLLSSTLYAVESIPERAQPMFTSEYTLPTKGPAYTSVYNPSLYTVLFPNSNAEAEANYNPLFPALSQRPFQNPVTMNKPIATTTSAKQCLRCSLPAAPEVSRGMAMRWSWGIGLCIMKDCRLRCKLVPLSEAYTRL